MMMIYNLFNLKIERKNLLLLDFSLTSHYNSAGYLDFSHKTSLDIWIS
jgi:hypothetical protein